MLTLCLFYFAFRIVYCREIRLNINIMHDVTLLHLVDYLGRAKRIWYLSPMRAAKVQASLRIRAVSPEPPLLAHTRIESRGTFRQKARSLAPLNGWACAVKVCHDGMLEDTNSLDGAHFILANWPGPFPILGVPSVLYFYFIFYKIPVCKQCRTWSDAAFCGVWFASALFACVHLWDARRNRLKTIFVI